MNKEQFVQQFITNFLATYAANNYVRQCQEGWTNYHPPYEDAVELAEAAWMGLDKNTDYVTRKYFKYT